MPTHFSQTQDWITLLQLFRNQPSRVQARVPPPPPPLHEQISLSYLSLHLHWKNWWSSGFFFGGGGVEFASVQLPPECQNVSKIDNSCLRCKCSYYQHLERGQYVIKIGHIRKGVAWRAWCPYSCKSSDSISRRWKSRTWGSCLATSFCFPCQRILKSQIHPSNTFLHFHPPPLIWYQMHER